MLAAIMLVVGPLGFSRVLGLVGSQAGPAVTKVAEPIPVKGSVVRLVAAGDVGTGSETEQRTADAIAALAGDHPYDGIILLGDNVYPDGDPERLPETVFWPFAATLDRGTHLLPVLGNHDVDSGHGDEQVTALSMPGRWYSTKFDDLLVVSLDSNSYDDPDQKRWLEETLAASDSKWIIATMHHPPYSAGKHGSSEEVRDAFVPVFERFGVQLVLAGHDHDYQRSIPIEGITYVVSGGAAKVRPTGEEAFTEVAYAAYHFVEISATYNNLRMRAVNSDGEIIDEITLRAERQTS